MADVTSDAMKGVLLFVVIGTLPSALAVLAGAVTVMAGVVTD